ncbi:MAG: hypothetical protein V8T86_01890 [Victivallis sp.]
MVGQRTYVRSGGKQRNDGRGAPVGRRRICRRHRQHEFVCGIAGEIVIVSGRIGQRIVPGSVPDEVSRKEGGGRDRSGEIRRVPGEFVRAESGRRSGGQRQGRTGNRREVVDHDGVRVGGIAGDVDGEESTGRHGDGAEHLHGSAGQEHRVEPGAFPHHDRAARFGGETGRRDCGLDHDLVEPVLHCGSDGLAALGGLDETERHILVFIAADAVTVVEVDIQNPVGQRDAPAAPVESLRLERHDRNFLIQSSGRQAVDARRLIVGGPDFITSPGDIAEPRQHRLLILGIRSESAQIKTDHTVLGDGRARSGDGHPAGDLGSAAQNRIAVIDIHDAAGFDDGIGCGRYRRSAGNV